MAFKVPEVPELLKIARFFTLLTFCVPSMRFSSSASKDKCVCHYKRIKFTLRKILRDLYATLNSLLYSMAIFSIIFARVFIYHPEQLGLKHRQLTFDFWNKIHNWHFECYGIFRGDLRGIIAVP